MQSIQVVLSVGFLFSVGSSGRWFSPLTSEPNLFSVMTFHVQAGAWTLLELVVDQTRLIIHLQLLVSLLGSQLVPANLLQMLELPVSHLLWALIRLAFRICLEVSPVIDDASCGTSHSKGSKASKRLSSPSRSSDNPLGGIVPYPLICECEMEEDRGSSGDEQIQEEYQTACLCKCIGWIKELCHLDPLSLESKTIKPMKIENSCESEQGSSLYLSLVSNTTEDIFHDLSDQILL